MRVLQDEYTKHGDRKWDNFAYLKQHFFAHLFKDFQHLASCSQSSDALVDQVSIRQIDNLAPVHPFKDAVVFV